MVMHAAPSTHTIFKLLGHAALTRPPLAGASFCGKCGAVTAPVALGASPQAALETPAGISAGLSAQQRQAPPTRDVSGSTTGCGCCPALFVWRGKAHGP